MTIHYVTPVYLRRAPRRALRARAVGPADEGPGHRHPRRLPPGPEPVVLDVPEGSTVRETPRGLAVIRPDGAVSYSNTWPPPADGRVKPTRWIHPEPAAAGIPPGGVAE